MWPAPPHLVQRVVLVMLRGSEFCQGRRILETQTRAVEPGELPQLHLSKVVLVLGRLDALLQDVANLWTPTSEPPVPVGAERTGNAQHEPDEGLTCSTAFFTFSMVLAVTSACRGSSSPGSICPSFRPTFPSFTEPLPRIMILAQHSFSMFFSVLPLMGSGEGDLKTGDKRQEGLHRYLPRRGITVGMPGMTVFWSGVSQLQRLFFRDFF
ncbi:hypothetical protein EYF80_052550 [Liparis tanakae]|uniref:Uncharacterized protein n=1 Tax=Liparis tanakae TaxID=230148 RepID=A0A4Z2F7S6_9TELE|nr:hypothetical protein EYF80_052550 [Liparis tanakae]